MLGFLAEALPDIRQPFAEPPEWSVLIDVGLIFALVGFIATVAFALYVEKRL